MLAGQWRPLARLFDRLEVWLGRLGRLLKAHRRGSSAAAKALVLLSALACVAALGYALFAWKVTGGRGRAVDARPARTGMG